MYEEEIDEIFNISRQLVNGEIRSSHPLLKKPPCPPRNNRFWRPAKIKDFPDYQEGYANIVSDDGGWFYHLDKENANMFIIFVPTECLVFLDRKDNDEVSENCS